MFKRLSLLVVLVLVMLPLVPARAQDGGGPDNPQLVFCEAGGCTFSEISGELSYEDTSLVLGEEDPHGNNVIVCQSGMGCQWSAVSPEDLDLVNGGDGIVEGEPMIFDEDEVDAIDSDEMIFDEDEVDAIDPDEYIFDLSDMQPTNVVPVPGAWMAYHLAGAMVCPGVMTIDIPAGDPQSGTLTVSEDGRTLDLENLDPEATSVPMQRVVPGIYHGELTGTVEGNSVTLNFDEVFITEEFGIGLIHAEIAAQGIECRLERRFWVEYTGGSAAVS